MFIKIDSPFHRLARTNIQNSPRSDTQAQLFTYVLLKCYLPVQIKKVLNKYFLLQNCLIDSDLLDKLRF